MGKIIESRQATQVKIKSGSIASEKPIRVSHSLVIEKIRIRGKFFYAGDRKFYMKGVTYGAFKPDDDGQEYHDHELIRKDFRMMQAAGLNTVRIPHTTPPPALLDIAAETGLKVMIGLSAEQLVGYLIDKEKSPDLKKLIQDKVRTVARHPALACIALGNEIPASTVRWIGRRKIEKYLHRVYRWVKEIDPETPVTYVNYPTTEYLQLGFLDFVCFNVYLENPAAFSSYLYKLHSIAGDRPLIMGEIGLDCLRNGEEKQKEFLQWQLPLAFGQGCAGVFIFSWTDEWFRGGEEVYDWAFGLTGKKREPKPSLQVLPDLMQRLPFNPDLPWPRISVIICSCNGSRTIRDPMEALLRQTYPDYEVIVVNDGSTDGLLDIVSGYPFKIIDSVNMGLSYARNLGIQASTGEIVAYLDDDSFPDPDWLWYIAYFLKTTDYAAVGGPNIIPENSGFVAQCVDYTPGTPTHILVTDQEAEHIPGCNMAFRKDWLEKIGGFDPRFRVAGDDVDLCWRIQEAGGKIGFAPGAYVWHHRRCEIRRFWKQQQGYGKAEALLENKWPERFNQVGHMSWSGKIYGKGSLDNLIFNNWRVYHGTWGMAPFQSIYQSNAGSFLAVTLMPEWYMVTVALLGIGLLGFLWSPLLVVLALAILAMTLPVLQIINKVRKIHIGGYGAGSTARQWKYRTVIAFLHMSQPLARLWGRLKHELTPWRRFGPSAYSMPIQQYINVWCDTWISPEIRMEAIENKLKTANQYVWRGGDFERWDLKMKGGDFGMAGICMAAEDHKEGHQYLRFRVRPLFTRRTKFLLGVFSLITLYALVDQAWIPAAVSGGIVLLVLSRAVCDSSIAKKYFSDVIKAQNKLG
jgi:GT2 family glycosyltransferase